MSWGGLYDLHKSNVQPTFSDGRRIQPASVTWTQPEVNVFAQTMNHFIDSTEAALAGTGKEVKDGKHVRFGEIRTLSYGRSPEAEKHHRDHEAKERADRKQKEKEVKRIEPARQSSSSSTALQRKKAIHRPSRDSSTDNGSYLSAAANDERYKSPSIISSLFRKPSNATAGLLDPPKPEKLRKSNRKGSQAAA